MIDHDPPPSSDRRRYTFGGGGVMSVLITLPQAHYSGGGRFPAHVEVGELTPYVQEGDFVSGVKVPGASDVGLDYRAEARATGGITVRSFVALRLVSDNSAHLFMRFVAEVGSMASHADPGRIGRSSARSPGASHVPP